MSRVSKEPFFQLYKLLFFRILDSVEIYDIDKRTWRVGPSLRRPLMGAAAVVSGGSIYVSGGITTPTVLRGPTCDRFNVINRVHALDVYTNT